MKKMVAVLIGYVMMMCGVVSYACNADDINIIHVFVNGREISDTNLTCIINNRTMVPLRSSANALGAEVVWNGDTQEITLTTKDINVWLKIGSCEMKVNGETKILDAPPVIIQNKTLVPVRAVSEAFGANVGWSDIYGKFVTVSTGKITQQQAIEIVKKVREEDIQYCYAVEVNRMFKYVLADPNNMLSCGIVSEADEYLYSEDELLTGYCVTIYWRNPDEPGEDAGISSYLVDDTNGNAYGIAG